MRSHRLFSSVLLALPLALAAACDSEDDAVDPDPEPTGTAQLRVIHGSPDAPAVDIYAAGIDAPLIEDLAYGETSGYLSVDAGSYTIDIRAAGAPANSTPAFSVGPLALADGDRISALAAGLLGSEDDADRFRVIPLAEQFSMPASGNAIVRIVHASADAPTVAVDVGNDATPEIESLARFAETGATGIELPAGTAIPIGIWAGDPAARVTAFTTPALPDGAELFVIATGLLAEHPREADAFSLLAVAPTGSVGLIAQDPTVFALHASPDAPAVDIYAGNAKLASDLAFGEISAPIQVPPGAYDLDFYGAGTGPGTPAATRSTPTLAAGQRYLAIASGFLSPTDGEPAFELIAVADTFALDDAANARIAAVHASPDAPAVDISTVTGGSLDAPVLIGDLSYPQATDGAGLSVPPASLTLGVAAADSTSPVATFDVATSAGLRAYAVAAGALSPAIDEEPFRLVLVVTSEWPWMAVEVAANE